MRVPTKKIVVLDPGHGLPDPGAIGPTGLEEAGVNLLLAHLLKDRLIQAGHKVVLTRADKEDPLPGIMLLPPGKERERASLHHRAELSNAHVADVFVSLHCDSVLLQPEIGGTKSFAFSPRCVEAVEIAKSIQASLVHATGLHDRGIDFANYQVLRETNAPAVLVEVAFISNPEEETKLRDVEFLSLCADGIAQGIREAV